MDPRRWERIQELFHVAVERPGAAQRNFLEAECADDPSLVDEILRMIERDRGVAGVLDEPLPVVAEHILSGSGEPEPSAIGQYEIQRVLGEGGMGTVFLGVRKDLGTTAAIKVLRDAWLSPARRGRFLREAQLLAQLQHPNIARLLDAGTLERGSPYFVMEHVEGLHLDEYCEARGLSAGERLRLFRSVCEAVRFAHQHAVIHRDLKPSNILVTPDGTVKLLDFGIARQIDELGTEADATRTGLRFMTPAFAAPEQVRGDPPAVSSDVYSLGVILYRLLTGRLPFEGREAGGDPAPPSSFGRESMRRSNWADLDAICQTALRHDVRQRFSSVEALMRDIDHYFAGEPLDARRETVVRRAGKFVRRHRAAVGTAALAIGATAALVTFFLARLATERNAALEQAARTQRLQQFVRNLFQGGDSDAGPSNDLRVAAVLERGVQEARVLDRDPAAQAELFQTVAEIYQKVGDFGKADELFGAALARRRAGGPATDRAAVAELTAEIAMLRVDQARFDEAERLSREAVAMSRAKLPRGHPVIAEATHALGRALEEKGSYDAAIPVLEEAVRLRSGVQTPELAESLYELANTYFYAGRYDKSAALNQRVLKMNREIYGERHPRVAEALVNLGAIEQERGNYREAERIQREALAITRGFFGETHYRTAAGFTMVARSLVYQKRFDEAVALLRQAVAIQERVFGPVTRESRRR